MLAAVGAAEAVVGFERHAVGVARRVAVHGQAVSGGPAWAGWSAVVRGEARARVAVVVVRRDRRLLPFTANCFE